MGDECKRCRNLTRIDLCNRLGDHRVFAEEIRVMLREPETMALPPKNAEDFRKKVLEALELLEEALREQT